ncbi:hypothetical protein LTR97_004229 [Elasticomyces elasticus]|uniref:Uncharacterized protein n=1 Tax=Elasticomyces elasticus TaxID=574655 RepID=A0AAN8A421_9PEZI|nr:hypothetical protein LTR97_004229 [Elasticomyces elasticus]
MTPLAIAAKFEETEIVSLLIGSGRVDVCSQDKGGATPLFQAVYQGCTFLSGKGRLSVVELLAETKQGINLKCSNGRLHGLTPLDLAAIWARSDLVRLLLEHGANPFDEDVWGHTPLTRAVTQGHWDVVEPLLARCTDLLQANDNFDSWGRACFGLPWLAVEFGHFDVLKRLIKSMSDIDGHQATASFLPIGEEEEVPASIVRYATRLSLHIGEGESMEKLAERERILFYMDKYIDVVIAVLQPTQKRLSHLGTSRLQQLKTVIVL